MADVLGQLNKVTITEQAFKAQLAAERATDLRCYPHQIVRDERMILRQLIDFIPSKFPNDSGQTHQQHQFRCNQKIKWQ